MCSFHNKSGAAALSTILLIGGIVVETAVASLVASYLVSQEGLGLKLSQDAALTARAGVEDGILYVIRGGEDAAEDTYSLDVGAWNTDVTIVKSILANNDTQFTITSSAYALNSSNVLRAIVIVDTTTGLVQVESISTVTS